MPSTTALPTATSFRCTNCRTLCMEVPHRQGCENFCTDCFRRLFFECHNCHQMDWRSHRCLIEVVGGPREVCRNCHTEYSTWVVGDFESNGDCEKVGSSRKFGLELETSECPDYMSLRGQTVWGAKTDCSVGGMEFTSPILQGDDGLASVQEFCAEARRMNFEVDSDCGMHLHIDMRGESDTALKSVAYAYLKTDAVWRLLVDSFRANDCSYCRRPQYNRTQLEEVDCFSDFCYEQDRYIAMNIAAYTKFHTYESRLYQGTLDATEICNWVKAHLRFTDWAKNKTFDEIDDAFRGSSASKWESLKAIFGDIDLNRYYGRIRRGHVAAASA